jgi:biopolymer transport protein ExbD
MKSFLKKKKSSEDLVLQITSMADIFMILLVFLLKNYSTSVSNLSATKDTKLPVARASATIKETLKLEVASDAILVDAKPIVKLNKFNFDPADLSTQGHSPMLFRVLSQERRRQPEPNMDSTLLILADERTPYQTLKPILASAANAGFVDLQLVVVESD